MRESGLKLEKTEPLTAICQYLGYLMKEKKCQIFNLDLKKDIVNEKHVENFLNFFASQNRSPSTVYNRAKYLELLFRFAEFPENSNNNNNNNNLENNCEKVLKLLKSLMVRFRIEKLRHLYFSQEENLLTQTGKLLNQENLVKLHSLLLSHLQDLKKTSQRQFKAMEDNEKSKFLIDFRNYLIVFMVLENLGNRVEVVSHLTTEEHLKNVQDSRTFFSVFEEKKIRTYKWIDFGTHLHFFVDYYLKFIRPKLLLLQVISGIAKFKSAKSANNELLSFWINNNGQTMKPDNIRNVIFQVVTECLGSFYHVGGLALRQSIITASMKIIYNDKTTFVDASVTKKALADQVNTSPETIDMYYNKERESNLRIQQMDLLGNSLFHESYIEHFSNLKLDSSDSDEEEESNSSENENTNKKRPKSSSSKNKDKTFVASSMSGKTLNKTLEKFDNEIDEISKEMAELSEKLQELSLQMQKKLKEKETLKKNQKKS